MKSVLCGYNIADREKNHFCWRGGRATHCTISTRCDIYYMRVPNFKKHASISARFIEPRWIPTLKRTIAYPLLGLLLASLFCFYFYSFSYDFCFEFKKIFIMKIKFSYCNILVVVHQFYLLVYYFNICLKDNDEEKTGRPKYNIQLRATLIWFLLKKSTFSFYQNASETDIGTWKGQKEVKQLARYPLCCFRNEFDSAEIEREARKRKIFWRYLRPVAKNVFLMTHIKKHHSMALLTLTLIR